MKQCHKKVQPGRIVASFILGTRKVYDFVNDNPFVNCMSVAFVNDSDVIRRNPKVVAICKYPIFQTAIN